MNLTNIIIFLIPLTTGYLMSYICPMKEGEAGTNVPARPPGWVFGIIWPILYILLGLVWVKLRKEKDKIKVDILFTLLIITLNSWIYVYSCLNKKKYALYILIVSLTISLTIFGYSFGTTELFYFTPLVAWLIFAIMLNFTEVNNI